MIYEKKFTLAEIATVLDKNPSTLRTHISRGYVVAWGPRNANGDKPAGKHSRFSIYTLMEFALAYKIHELGIGLDVAFKAAANFAHAGGGGEVFGLPERMPGMPFHFENGDTIFAFSKLRSFEELWKPGEDYDTFGNLRTHLGGASFVSINATELFDLVVARLGYHPNEVLDSVYK